MESTSLVLELQHLASNSGTPVSELMLKAKMVAMKLGLTDMVAQIDREISGYDGATASDDLPKYRWIYGTVMYRNPFHGLQPMVFMSSREREEKSLAYVGNSVAGIEDAIKTGVGSLYFELPDAVRADIRAHSDVGDMPVVIVVGKSALLTILTRVRASILNWALALEQKGIMGVGMTFTPKEKREAATTSTTINFHRIDNMQGIVGSVQDSVVTQSLKQSIVKNDRASLRAHLKSAGVPDADLDALDGALDAEPEAKGGILGEKVGAWIGGMVQKAATGVVKLASERGVSFLMDSLFAFYGIVPIIT